MEKKMDKKFTKGEWKVLEDFRDVKILNESNQPMFQSNINCFDDEDELHKYYSHNRMLANAKLIAAAPDLLEALQMVYSKMNAELFSENEFDLVEKAIEKALK